MDWNDNGPIVIIEYCYKRYGNKRGGKGKLCKRLAGHSGNHAQCTTEAEMAKIARLRRAKTYQ